MTEAQDRARAAKINADPLAKLLHDEIEKLPHAQRLYPDLFALSLAERVRAGGRSCATPADGLRGELRELAEAATPGEWRYYETLHGDTHVVDERGFIFDGMVATTPYQRENARFIAAANPQAVLELLRQVDELGELARQAGAHLPFSEMYDFFEKVQSILGDDEFDDEGDDD
ncbi:ead/Ea22-like family protein [Agromyces humi]|uniref:ead/Ea22-like family protein n=1 Tax=Agromyces humi TaxID=1766800 RepID=UPI00135C0D32|nr:ead/Ea22-like family protein [Agromyces humi]